MLNNYCIRTDNLKNKNNFLTIMLAEIVLAAIIGTSPVNSTNTDSLKQDTSAVAKTFKSEMTLQDAIDINLEELTERLESDGYRIDTLVADSRFKVYTRILKTFRTAKEKKADEREDAAADTLSKEEAEIRAYDYYKRGRMPYLKRKVTEFIKNNYETFKAAEQEHEICMTSIASIIGIETNFGNTLGTKNPFNATVSLYIFNENKKVPYDRITDLLTWTRKYDIDVLGLESSFAGAMGPMQFMPHNLYKFKVEDPYDMDTAIFKVGEYLAFYKRRSASEEEWIRKYNNHKFYYKMWKELKEFADEKLPELEKNINNRTSIEYHENNTDRAWGF